MAHARTSIARQRMLFAKPREEFGPRREKLPPAMGLEYVDWLQDALVRCLVGAWLAVLRALGCGGRVAPEHDEDELEDESVMLRPLISTARRPSVAEKLTMSPVEKMRECCVDGWQLGRVTGDDASPKQCE